MGHSGKQREARNHPAIAIGAWKKREEGGEGVLRGDGVCERVWKRGSGKNVREGVY